LNRGWLCLLEIHNRLSHIDMSDPNATETSIRLEAIRKNCNQIGIWVSKQKVCQCNHGGCGFLFFFFLADVRFLFPPGNLT
jgi:hypothetical protein